MTDLVSMRIAKNSPSKQLVQVRNMVHSSKTGPSKHLEVLHSRTVPKESGYRGLKTIMGIMVFSPRYPDSFGAVRACRISSCLLGPVFEESRVNVIDDTLRSIIHVA